MTKNIIQDVVTKKRSIRQISIERGGRSVRSETKKIATEEFEKIKPRSSGIEKRREIKKRNTPKIMIWTIDLLSIFFFLFSITSFFSTASVTIHPRVERVSFDDSYIARKNALPGELQFEVMTLQKKMSKQLEATEMQNSEIKASGKIVVYNNFSEASQRLIINTRFESENGLIYKIPASITVPGIKTINGKKVPGSIETEI